MYVFDVFSLFIGIYTLYIESKVRLFNSIFIGDFNTVNCIASTKTVLEVGDNQLTTITKIIVILKSRGLQHVQPWYLDHVSTLIQLTGKRFWLYYWARVWVKEAEARSGVTCTSSHHHTCLQEQEVKWFKPRNRHRHCYLALVFKGLIYPCLYLVTDSLVFELLHLFLLCQARYKHYFCLYRFQNPYIYQKIDINWDLKPEKSWFMHTILFSSLNSCIGVLTVRDWIWITALRITLQ